MEDSVVIKVKYGNVLRRFNAPITDDKLFVNMDRLREKILSLFSLAPDTDLMLTYLDEDDEVITLVDDNDLHDIVKQELDPVRVTLNVNNVTNANQTYSNVSYPPLPRPNLITRNSGSAAGDAFKKATSTTWYPKKDDVDLGLIRRVCGITPLENISAASPHSASDANPFRGSHGQDDSSGSYCHWGVGCDGCGIVPIVGPRFKSKVKLDYDLCLDCHSKIGNDNDYVRIDRPEIARHHLPYSRARDRGAIPRVLRCLKFEPSVEKLDSRFIQDVNIFDGAVMEPLTPFTKIWRMRNSGTLAWPKKTKLVWIGGDQLTDAESIEVPIPDAGLLVDQELDVSIHFISPNHSGRYISYWRMASPSGEKFGQRVWVIIQVEAPAIEEESPRETLRNLNLNLPPPPPIFKLPPPPPRRTPIASIPESIELRKKSLMEDKLLGELKEMGFEQVDRNKQLLRMNGYDLDQAVGDLCGVSEWDRILEELEEMGFHNTEMNKKLLTKNNGSIKRVVMDLIAGVEEV
ncbi:protein JOKA2-like [Salvia splendens]|uniref:protein JOKA2-like n=1 Tax=Salvia splendens TaxID=180675 RepID=UPI001C27ACDC|nr:protein JOKA2-like [Salvia splendens]